MNNTSHSDNGEFWTIINGLNLLLVFIVTYFFVYMQTQGLITADTRQHIHFMQQYFEGQVYIPHPLWHIGTYYLSHLLGVDYSVGASVFTAFLVTFYAMVIYKIAQSLDTHKRDYAKWFLITFVSLVIGPFFLMSFNSRIYLGQGSPSVWHNVMLLTLKPLALLSVFYTIKFFASNQYYHFILAVIVTVASIFAKPNYIIIFLPSLLVYMILKKYFDKRQLQFTLVTVLLSIAALAYQFTNEFGGKGEGSIIFDFLGVWSIYSPSIPISILMVLGLPLLITFFNYQSVKENEFIKFSWLLVFFAFVLFACFAEGGKHYSHGNFSWSWHLSLSLIYVFTIIEYFKHYFSMSAVIRYSLLAIMLYQLYVGWYFLIGMFNGINYNDAINTFPFF